MIVAMSASFVRLSVVSGDRQLDVSLPANRPVGEFIIDVTDLLEVEPSDPPPVWSLSNATSGVVPLESSLAEAGVLDGAVLTLTSIELAAVSPFVDDVIAETAATIDRRCELWGGTSRDRGVALIVLALLAVPAVVLAIDDRGTFGALALVMLAMGIMVTALITRRRTNGVLSLALVPVFAALAVVVVPAGHPATALLAAIGTALLGGAIAASINGIRRGVAMGCVATGLAYLACGGAVFLGANTTALSAWLSPVLVAMLSLAPRMALASSGLLGLVRQAEDGASIDGGAVDSAVLRGRDVVDVAVIGIAIGGSLAVATLIWNGVWLQAGLGLLVALVFLLRSRTFSHTRNVAPLLLVPTAAGVVLALRLSSSIGAVDDTIRPFFVVGAIGMVTSFVAVGGFVRLGEVAAARLARLWNALDPFLAVMLLPAAFLAQGIYTYFIG